MSNFPEDLSLELPFDTKIHMGDSRASLALERQVTDLFDQLRGNLLRYLCCLGLSVDDGEEIVQEAFILLFQHLRQQKSRENLRGWLFRVAHNLGLKRRAALQTLPTSAAAGDAYSERHAASDPSPEEQAWFRQRQRRLLAVVDALPPQDRHCLYLRSEGLQYREIAAILEISLGGVAKSLARTLQRLASSENISKQGWTDAPGI